MLESREAERLALLRQQCLHASRFLPGRRLQRHEPGRLPDAGSVSRPGRLQSFERAMLEPVEAERLTLLGH
jgi:hypothetical protein